MPIATDGVVLPWRSAPVARDVLIGKPVRASTWAELAHLVQWVRGRGRVLVPMYAPMTVFGAPASAVTFRHRSYPSGVAISRVWCGEVRGVSGAYASYTVQAGGDAARTYFTGSSEAAWPFVYVETAATKTTAATDLTVVITATNAVVESLGCWELPRAALARSADDLGLSLDSFYPRRPIYQATYEGPYALATAIAAMTTRRVGLVSWYNDTGIAFSGGYSDGFLTGVPLVPALDLIADTTRTCVCDVYAAASNGTTGGDCVVRDAAGADSAVLTIGVGSTAFSWRGPVTKAFKCEDPSTTNGLRGGTYDTAMLRGRVTAGAGTIIVKGWVVVEKD